MPPSAYTYALPAELCQFEGLRRYGAHGTSYSFLLAAAARMLGRDASSLNLIACHIGVPPPSPRNTSPIMLHTRMKRKHSSKRQKFYFDSERQVVFSESKTEKQW